jgi:hypothetical protein
VLPFHWQTKLFAFADVPVGLVVNAMSGPSLDENVRLTPVVVTTVPLLQPLAVPPSVAQTLPVHCTTVKDGVGVET